MGYFDRLTDASFKFDSEGKLLFYRWGILGKAYVLPDESKKQQVRRFVTLYYKLSLPIIIGIGATVGWIFNFLLLPVLFFWYFVATARLLKGLGTSSARLTLRESYSSSGKSHSMTDLRVMLAFSILFVLAGLLFLLVKKDEWIGGLSSILFFGACAIAIGYMIKIKNT